MNYKYIASLPRNEDEDRVQESWLKALEKTDQRPAATTKEELFSRYDHIAGLVTHIYRHERIHDFRKPKELPLTDDIPMWYNIDDPLEECTDEQLEAISYYLEVTGQNHPLSVAQRVRLARLRKRTGLALTVDTRTSEKRRQNAST